MGWLIRVGSAGLAHSTNADVITSTQCLVTSTPCHTVAQWQYNPNTGKAATAGVKAACQTEQVWQNVLSTLVGFD